MNRLLKVTVNDFRLIFRDNSLKFFMVLPLLNIFVVRYGMPYAITIFPILEDYLRLMIMMVTVQGSLAFGFIYSMVLLDERDTNVAKVYGVLPVSQFWFINFRLVAPFAISAIATFLILLAEPFYGLGIVSNAQYSILAGFVAPMMALFVAMVSKNKIEAMTWQKLFNIPVTLPILAFFVPASVSFVFGVLPMHWAFQGFNSLIEGNGFIVYFTIGLFYNVLLIGLLAQRFSKTHFI